MAIETHKDPRTRSSYMLATGTVDGLFLNKLDNPKTYTSGKAPWTPTHAINLIVDGDKISLGLTDKEVVRCKDVDGNYLDLTKGSEVSIVVEEAGEYKGVPQYQSKVSLVTIVEHNADGYTSDGSRGGSNNTKGNTGGYSKNLDGILQGHALKGGAILMRQGMFEDLVEAAKFFHDATSEVKEWYEANSKLDAFSVGNGAGNAVNTAVEIIESTDELVETAIEILEYTLPQVAVHIKGTEVDPTKVVKPKKAAPKKAAKKDAPVEATEEPLDDDIPF